MQIDFVKLKAKHFDELDNTTLRVFRDYCFHMDFRLTLTLALIKPITLPY